VRVLTRDAACRSEITHTTSAEKFHIVPNRGSIQGARGESVSPASLTRQGRFDALTVEHESRMVVFKGWIPKIDVPNRDRHIALQPYVNPYLGTA